MTGYSNARLSINLPKDHRHFDYGLEKENKARSGISSRVPICTCRHSRVLQSYHHGGNAIKYVMPGNIGTENDLSHKHRLEKIVQTINVDALVENKRELHVMMPSADADWWLGERGDAEPP